MADDCIEQCMGQARPQNRVIFRILVPALHDAAKKYAKGKLLDIGCAEKPWAPLFENFVTGHVGLDHSESSHSLNAVDVVADAYDTGLTEASFDTVLCAAVLEHLEEPERALGEAYRLLRPGGYAIYTIPLFWHVHESPRDFYRYTRHGIQYLFEKVGFEIIELKAQSGFWVTFGTEFNYYLLALKKTYLAPLGSILIFFNNLVMGALGKIDRSESWTWLYLVVARKPESGQNNE